MYVHRHPEENRLSVVYQFLTFTDQQSNIIPFLIKPDEFGFLYLIIRFVLISIIHVPFQVHHIADCSQSDVFQAAFHFTLVVVFTLFVILFQIIVNIFIQSRQVILHERYIDFFIYFEHIFKEFQINILHFKEVASVPDNSIVYQIADTLFFVLCHFKRIIVAERKRFPFSKHFFQEFFLSVETLDQFFYGTKSTHLIHCSSKFIICLIAGYSSTIVLFLIISSTTLFILLPASTGTRIVPSDRVSGRHATKQIVYPCLHFRSNVHTGSFHIGTCNNAGRILF